jgi:lactoylglutathione lyase
MKTFLFALRVSDLDRSRTFYRTLGYVELGTIPLDGGSTLVWLRLPDEPSVSLELAYHPGEGAVPVGGFQHLAIEVESLEETVERIQELQPGEVEFPAGADGPRISWLTDPDGYRIELVEWPAGGAPTFEQVSG